MQYLCGRDFEYCLCFDDNQQYHFNGGKVLVKDWLYRNFPREDKEFLKQQYRAIPEIGKLMRRIPEELRRASVFKILLYHYYNFDLDQPFLPQYEQNMIFVSWHFWTEAAPMLYALEHFSAQGTGGRPCRCWVQYAICGKHEILEKVCQNQRRPEEWRVIPLAAGAPEERSAA